ncbi:Uncharacterised protein [Mycobacteroides abscessus subsp. abscessus]|nr:Uncharacterised protein [Mycobacteroides abscessus subsp. abscessus]
MRQRRGCCWKWCVRGCYCPRLPMRNRRCCNVSSASRSGWTCRCRRRTAPAPRHALSVNLKRLLPRPRKLLRHPLRRPNLPARPLNHPRRYPARRLSRPRHVRNPSRPLSPSRLRNPRQSLSHPRRNQLPSQSRSRPQYRSPNLLVNRVSPVRWTPPLCAMPGRRSAPRCGIGAAPPRSCCRAPLCAPSMATPLCCRTIRRH